MQKPFDKKSTSGLSKKPEPVQTPKPGSGATTGVKPERSPDPKAPGHKSAAQGVSWDRPVQLAITWSGHGSEHGISRGMRV